MGDWSGDEEEEDGGEHLQPFFVCEFGFCAQSQLQSVCGVVWIEVEETSDSGLTSMVRSGKTTFRKSVQFKPVTPI